MVDSQAADFARDAEANVRQATAELRRLVHDDSSTPLVTAEAGVSETGRRVRFYTLTRDGAKQLKREIARLKAERDILKKAAAYFAKEST